MLVLLVNFSPVQNFIVKKATNILSDKLKTRVSIKHIRIDLLNHISVQGVYVQDHARDTLLYAGALDVRITDWFFLKKETPMLSYLGLKDAYVHLYRNKQSAEWNYQFIADAFAGDSTKPKEKKSGNSGFQLDLKKIDLENVRFHMDDRWTGSDYDIDLGALVVNANDVDFKKKIIDLQNLRIDKAIIAIADYKGGKPPSPRKPRVIDTTAFNDGKWSIKLGSGNLADCRFILKLDEPVPLPNEFDPTNMDVQHLNISTQDLTITGDTIKAKLKNLSLQERCGFVIKEMHADVTVSPNASICKNLLMVTNNSRLSDYYAMHYKRFPDFEDYVTKVRMVGSLQNATVDVNDIAFFAPALKDFNPSFITLSGKFDGTVAKFETQDLDVTDGASIVKGNLAMTGLPEIDKTFIEYTRGTIFTTGFSILKYVPSMRNNPSLAVEKLSYLRFAGNFIGFTDRFVANGKLLTNLGNITSNINLSIPASKTELIGYKGTVATDAFNIGLLLRQPELGMVSVAADVEGKGLDAETANIRLNARIVRADIHRYTYHNIIAEGTLSKGKFNGDLTVDDPNLALAFTGEALLQGKTVSINATANLLHSNLKTLNFTEDSVIAVADFDLNWTGSSIDSFDGYAKLYNINLVRNSNRVDIDSISIKSGETDGEQSLTLQSNDVSLYLHGNYQLSLLPYSFQHYLHGYLPNYLSEPARNTPNQNIIFDIKTRKVDNLLTVLNPSIRGFDNSSVSGYINTNTSELTLTANVPRGYIGPIKMDSINVNSSGNDSKLEIKTFVKQLSINDSLLKISVNATASLGKDSFLLNVVTASPYSYGTANLNVSGFAIGDSMTITMLPSELYLVKNKWEIDGANKIVLADKRLSIYNFHAHSGIEEVNVDTKVENGLQQIVTNIKDLDLSTLSGVAGLAAYQIDGRINGRIDATDLMGSKTKIAADLKASGVKMGRDTVGDVVVNAAYDGVENQVIINKQTGIFYNSASLAAEGKLGLGSTGTTIDTRVQLSNAKLSWIQPVLSGLFSNLKGALNGNVNITGTTNTPNIDGKVDVTNAGLKVDYTGVDYTLDKATVTVNNTDISFGDVTLKDRYKNTGTLGGSVTHNHLKNFNFKLRLNSDKIEAVNLKEGENENFYGNVIASIPSLTINGPINDLKMNLRALPAQKSKLFLPIVTTTKYGTYSYVTFKTYGQEQAVVKNETSKFSMTISAQATPDLTVSLILDPASGDQINATGSGNISMNFSTTGDFGINGIYNIDNGNYYFTFRQLALRRNFLINAGSSINFGGSLDKTTMDVKGTYRLSAKLFDLLSKTEIERGLVPDYEQPDAKTAQNVDVLLFMKGSLDKPDLSFKLDLPEKRSIGTYAYTKLERINQNDRELFDQVASLLLIGSFYPPEGLIANSAISGGINNMSQILSSTASSQLTGIVNKLLGNKNTQIEVNYKNYNDLTTTTATYVNRNEFRVGIKQSLFNERVVVEAASTYDWGNTTTVTNNLNLAGDFRLQYLITQDGRLRFNLFRSSSYDLVLVQGGGLVYRNGAGISWRKTFNNFSEFIHSDKYNNMKMHENAKKLLNSDSMGTKKQ